MTSLKNLAQKINSCKLCELHKNRTNGVPGTGIKSATIMIIGEAPGKKEDEQGKPFVGQAGKVLDELLKEINLDRKKVFIANIVKCRPPENRDPLKKEIKKCFPYLEKQIKIIDPKIIVTLGRHAMNTLLPKDKISELHGKTKNSEILNEKKIFVMYHPAFALYNPRKKDILKKDIRKIKKYLK